MATIQYELKGSKIYVKDNPKIPFFDFLSYPKDNLIDPSMYHEVGIKWGSSPTEVLLNRQLTDLIRFSKWAITGKGANYIGTQIGLQLMQPKVEKLIGTLISQNRIYLYAKELANIAVRGTGIRFPRSGGIVSNYMYEPIVKFNNEFSIKKNRLIKIGKELSLFSNIKPIVSTQFPIFTISGLSGPESFFGIGATIIRTATNNNPISIEDRLKQKYNSDTQFDEENVTENNILIQKFNNDFVNNSDSVPEKNKNNIVMKNYITDSYQKLSDITNAAKDKNGADRTSVFSGIENTYLNFLFNDSSKSEDEKSYLSQWNKIVSNMKDFDLENEEVDINKIILVEIFRYPLSDELFTFRAFIDGWSDKMGFDWGTEVRYIGRPDTVQLFTGVKRDISFGLYIIKSGSDSRSIGKKLNILTKLALPKFENGKMISPILNLRLGDFFVENGYFTNLSVNLDENTIWDLNYGSIQQPIIAKVDISFNVLFTNLPSVDSNYFPEVVRANTRQ